MEDPTDQRVRFIIQVARVTGGARETLTVRRALNNIVAAFPTRVPLTDSAPARIWKNVVLRAALYYVALFIVTWLLRRIPVAKQVMRGSFDQLVGSGGFTGLGGPSSLTGVGNAPISETTLALTVLAAMVGAVALALPVAWIYGLTRSKKGYQQSVVQTLMILPPLVASVVVLVKYSLALAFGLGGIMAAIRFRSTLEDSKDAVYIFLATAIGLTAAVQLPVAAIISIVFNIIILALWYADFGKSVAFEGARARKAMEETRAAMRQTGTFVAMVDEELFENMTPQQLDLVADRAWRRRRRMETDEPDDQEMQKRDVLLRVKTTDTDAARIQVEQTFEEFLKKWRLGGVVHEPDGTHIVEYAIQLKKSTRSSEFLDELNEKDIVMEAEIR